MSKQNCIYDGKTYSDGSKVCQAGEVHRCDDGEWTNLHYDCDEIREEPLIKGLEILDAGSTAREPGIESASAGAQALCPGNTLIDTNVVVRGGHTYVLRNEGQAALSYSIELRLVDDKGNSFRETQTVSLRPGESKRGTAESFFQAAYSATQIGVIRVTATTTISGGASDSATGTCSFNVSRR
jgi:hypothetical protein